MSAKVFVGGLPWAVDDEGLRDAFASFGEVVEAVVVKDRETGRSRGFGFVTFSDNSQAVAARNAMDGQELQGRRISVREAEERRGPGGGGGGGGGRGGGGYGGGGRGGGGGGYGGGGGGYGGGGGGGGRGGRGGGRGGGGDRW